jgi:hypothetical protein
MRISTFKNKIKTTWNIVKSETGRKKDIEQIPTISYNGLRIDDQRTSSLMASLVITGTDPAQFSVDANTIFNNVNEWFRRN